ncbi:MAG: hypothetical protein ACQESP_06625 [Candidatus Muiribacteriota bacterium]
MKWELTEKERIIVTKLFSLGKHMALTKQSEFFSSEDKKALYDVQDKIKRKLQTPEKKEYEKNLSHHIEKYNDEIFWQELSYRMAERDLYKEQQTDSPLKDMDEIFERKKELIKKYNNEFYESGLIRIKLDESEETEI